MTTIETSNDENDQTNSQLNGTKRYPLHERRLPVIQLDSYDEKQSYGESERTCRFNILSLLPLTDNPTTNNSGNQVPIDFRVDIEVSGWLAYYHYTNQSSNIHAVLPQIYEKLSKCDIDFYYSMRDTSFSAINAAREFTEAYGIGRSGNTYSYNNNTAYPEGSLLDNLQEILLNETTKEQRDNISRPHAVIGSARSAVTSVLGYLTSANSIPHISSTSTAEYLNNKDIYSTFARTIPTNAGDAKAIALYLKHLNVTHVAVIFINDGYGNDFHSDIVKEATAFNITVVSEPYDDLQIERSIRQISASQLTYIVAILNPSTWRKLLRQALQYNIIGLPKYFWIFGESSLQFVTSNFQLDRETETDLARALHGSAVIAYIEKAYTPFDSALNDFAQNPYLQKLYIDQHVEADVFRNYTFISTDRSIYQYFTYDAVVAMMLAACEVSLDDDLLDSGINIYKKLLETEFDGVSGYVKFDPITGTREISGILGGVRNILFPEQLSSDTKFIVSSRLTHFIDLNNTIDPVETVEAFIYASNTTLPPSPLPPVVVDLNLIPTGVLAFCLSLCGLIIAMSVWWIVWTFINRDKDIVKASQPIFLSQICIGTIIIASAIIPMSLQEPIDNRGLDIACMATPWLVSVGFVTTFSALFTKTWRLNKLFRHSRNLRRVVIRPKDVVLPFVLLMILNISVILVWTLEAPLVWMRDYSSNLDKFGRSVESVGRCVPSNSQHTIIYLSLIGAINISVLIFAMYQAYLSRNLPSEFSESTHITIAMGSLLEVFILGIPLLFVASSDPSINYLVRSILVTVTCLSAILPIFLPKYFKRNVNKRYHDAVVAGTGAAPVKKRVVISGLESDSNQPNSNKDSNSSGLTRGISRIQRNEEYFKQKQASFMNKSKSASLLSSTQSSNARLPSLSERSTEMSSSSVVRSSALSTSEVGTAAIAILRSSD